MNGLSILTNGLKSTVDEPLTMEQLRERDGKQVFIKDIGGLYKSGVATVTWGDLLCIAKGEVEWYDIEEYGKEFVAYDL